MSQILWVTPVIWYCKRVYFRRKSTAAIYVYIKMTTYLIAAYDIGFNHLRVLLQYMQFVGDQVLLTHKWQWGWTLKTYIILRKSFLFLLENSLLVYIHIHNWPLQPFSQFLTPLMLCVLILYISGGTVGRLWTTDFLRNFSWQF